MIHEVFPYLCVHDAKEAIAFYENAFGARENFRLAEPNGRIGHADFGGATLVLADEFPEYGIRSARAIGETPVTIHLHVDDSDAVIAKALTAGAIVEREPKDQFFGERSGTILDPFGHRWNIGHSIEKVSPEEMQARYSKMVESE